MQNRGPETSSHLASRDRSASVLVVDDEAMMCDLLRNMLQDDYQVTTFSDPQAALACMLGETFFDIVMCDIMMPGLSGMDLHTLIARESPRQAERFVFMTGGTFTERVNTFIDGLRTPVLRKPFRLSELSHAIQDRLGQAGGAYVEQQRRVESRAAHYLDQAPVVPTPTAFPW